VRAAAATIRSFLRRRAPKPPGATAAVLTYHRVDRPADDPWLLAVDPANFADQLAVIRDAYRPLHLRELVTALRSDSIPERAVVVTFDDGYRDNLENAKPLLERYGVPATLFTVSAYLDSNRSFWWDELAQLCLAGTLPPMHALDADGVRVEWDVDEPRRSDEAETTPWTVWEEPRTRAEALLVELWAKLRPLEHAPRLALLDRLRELADVAVPAPNTLAAGELVELAEDGLVEIGGHTATHPPLPMLSPAAQREEIRSGKAELETLLGRRVESFSYPYGEFAEPTIELVRGAGFACASTVDAAPVTRASRPLELPRISVRNWSGSELAERLEHWLRG
jgi:peptidoglycan/xylan/chitin deacetylase (PgdA/CDA1 family)